MDFRFHGNDYFAQTPTKSISTLIRLFIKPHSILNIN